MNILIFYQRIIMVFYKDKLNFYKNKTTDSTKFEITNFDFLGEIVFQNRVSRINASFFRIKIEYTKVEEAHDKILDLINQELNE